MLFFFFEISPTHRFKKNSGLLIIPFSPPTLSDIAGALHANPWISYAVSERTPWPRKRLLVIWDAYEEWHQNTFCHNGRGNDNTSILHILVCFSLYMGWLASVLMFLVLFQPISPGKFMFGLGKTVVTCFFFFFFLLPFPRALTAFLLDRTSLIWNGDQGESATLVFFLKWNSYIVILLPSTVSTLQIYLAQCGCIFCIPVSVMLIYCPAPILEGIIPLHVWCVLQSRDLFFSLLFFFFFHCLCLCTQILSSIHVPSTLLLTY